MEPFRPRPRTAFLLSLFPSFALTGVDAAPLPHHQYGITPYFSANLFHSTAFLPSGLQTQSVVHED